MGERASQMKSSDWHEDASSALDDRREILSEDEISVTDETERLRADIEDTRAEMGQTINEIQERLSPEHIMGQVKESVRDATIGKVERVMDKVGEKIGNVTEPAAQAVGRAGTAIKETSSSVIQTVRQNPVPAALIGLGVGMLVVNKYRNRGDGYDWDEEGYSRSVRSTRTDRRTSLDAYEGVAGDTWADVKGKATDITGEVGERIGQFGTQAKQQALRISSQTGRLMRENPLAVGAIAIAVGAALGLALPSTPIERQYMGDASEKLVDKAQQVARDAMEKVESVAAGTGESKQQSQSRTAAG